MISKPLTVSDALERGRTLPWAWVRSLSAVTLGPVPGEIDREELIEARFFSSTEEVRLFRAGGELRAALLREEPEDDCLERTYTIKNPRFGKTITVRCDLGADDDGQTVIVSTRLAGWKEENA